jgi:hypothetical protein
MRKDWGWRRIKRRGGRGGRGGSDVSLQTTKGLRSLSPFLFLLLVGQAGGGAGGHARYLPEPLSDGVGPRQPAGLERALRGAVAGHHRHVSTTNEWDVASKDAPPFAIGYFKNNPCNVYVYSLLKVM